MLYCKRSAMNACHKKNIYNNAKIAFLLRKSNLLVYFVAKNQA